MHQYSLQVIAAIVGILAGILTLAGPLSQTPWPAGVALIVVIVMFVVLRQPRFVIRDFLDLPGEAFVEAFRKGSRSYVGGELWRKLTDVIRLHEERTAEAEAFVRAVCAKWPQKKDVEFSDDFSDYCRRCSELVELSSGRILTVQTPYDAEGDHRTAFTTYIQNTVKKLLEQHDGRNRISLYRRLIIVDSGSFGKEQAKLNVFLDELFKEGNRREPRPTYDNIEVCVVHRKFASDLFYTNLDVHITSDLNYAIAFQRPSVTSSRQTSLVWASAIHFQMQEAVRSVYENVSTLREAFNTLWARGCEEGGLVSLKTAYNQTHDNYLEEQNRLRETLTVKMAEVAKAY